MTERDRRRIENKARAEFIKLGKKYGIDEASSLRNWEQQTPSQRRVWVRNESGRPGVLHRIIEYFSLPATMSFEYAQRQRPGPTGAVVWIAGIVLHCVLVLITVLVVIAFVAFGLSVIAQVGWWLLTGERLLLL